MIINTVKKASDIRPVFFEPDSAGIIYPYAASKKNSNVFRIEAEIDRNIEECELKKAVSMIYKHFPSFFVQIKKYKSHYVLYNVNFCNIVEKETEQLCRPFVLENSEKPLIRVTYKENKIGVEAFHTVTDGHGLLMFLDGLLLAYCSVTNHIVYESLTQLFAENNEKKTEDSFASKFSSRGGKSGRIGRYAHQIKFSGLNENLSFYETAARSSLLYYEAKKRGATVTQIIVSAYIYSILKSEGLYRGKPVSISVPVDMRKLFPSETLRNFSLFIIISVKPRKEGLTFDEILNQVKSQFCKKLNREKLAAAAHKNVSDIKSVAFRCAPLFLKKAALKFGYIYLGEKYYTSTVTSFGRINLSDELKNHVKAVRVILGQSPVNAFGCSVVSLGDTTRITFSSKYDINSFVNTFEYVLNSIVGVPVDKSALVADKNNIHILPHIKTV